MADKKYFINLDLLGNEIKKFKIYNVGSLTGSLTAGDAGRIEYRTSDKTLHYWDGTAWQQIGGTGSLLSWQNTVEDYATTPPVSPADGERYLVKTTATGDWATHEGEIATWNDGLSVWEFTTPVNGYAVIVKTELTKVYIYTTSGDEDGWTKQSWEATDSGEGVTIQSDYTADLTIDTLNAGTTTDVADLIGIYDDSASATVYVTIESLIAGVIGDGLEQDATTKLINVKPESTPTANEVPVKVSADGVAVGIDNDTIKKDGSDQLYVSDATTSQTGAVELADETETKTGTDTERAVTPDAMADHIWSYSDTFNDTTDWAGAGPYTLTYAAAGGHHITTVQFVSVKDANDEEVEVLVDKATGGTVIVTSNAKFAGAVDLAGKGYTA